MNKNTSKTDFTPIRKKKLYEEIVDQIWKLIKSGKFSYGDRIPPERELIKIFQVSRNTVRDAIRTLEENNVLHRKQGNGTYVISSGVENALVDSLTSAIHKEKIKMREIYQFRSLIEPEIAGLAAQNATKNDIDKLLNILNAQKLNTKNILQSLELDIAFHRALANISKNSIYILITEKLNDLLKDARNEILLTTKMRELSYRGHLEIYKMIKEKKYSLAKKAMKKHVKTMEELVLNK